MRDQVTLYVNNGVNEEYKSCDDCIYADDADEICMSRRCVHAIGSLVECYTPKKTGHWIECADEVKVFCSECKEVSDYPTKYCSNCGAKMRENIGGKEK